MSAKLTFLSALICGLVVAAGFLWLLDPSRGIRPIDPQTLTIPVEVPLPGTVETQIAALVEEQSNELVRPAPTAEVAEAVPPAATAEIASAPAETPATEAGEDPQVTFDKDILSRRYAEFAYTEFAGYLSTKKMATFHNNLTGEKEKALEGGMIHGLRLDSIEEDRVLLSYGKSGTISKPRVEFEIRNDPSKALTEEEQKARMLRYQELFGNRFRVAAKDADPTGEGKPLRLPSPAEEQEAKKKYRETYGLLFQRMSAGDPTIDLREVPNPDLNFDETVKRYFETHWPGQVEVSTEEETPSSTDTGNGTSQK